MSGAGQPVRPDTAAAWREPDPESGDPVFVCPRCWPAVAARRRSRADATVREPGPRPAWARCGVCEPEDAC